tara:strand:+ start:5801 stop:6178 length:378 start_codon:yes stop_codon:yes gene_type:complete
MAKKTVKAPAKKKPAAKKPAAKKKKKSIILDVNADGIVDEKDVELVKKAAAKPKPKAKSEAFTQKDKEAFKKLTNRSGIKWFEIENACSEVFKGKAIVVKDKNNLKCYHLQIGNQKFPKSGIFTI